MFHKASICPSLISTNDSLSYPSIHLSTHLSIYPYIYLSIHLSIYLSINLSIQVLCKVLAGILHFLFLCCFMWMSIEAVLLFLSVRKLKQVKPNDRAGLHWKLSLLIGYGIPLIIVGVSASVWPDGYGSPK